MDRSEETGRIEGGCPVVAVVSSKGGLAATRTLLAAFPADMPAAVITLQHLDPARTSDLPHLLAPHSALEVVAASDAAVLRRGRVVVAPSGWHTLVGPGPSTLLIRSGLTPPARPSADLLFTSLALRMGFAAIAVVLSGTGHDGATGVSAVKRCGGTVLVCDEASSEFFGMPGAAMQREVVDHVLPLAQLGAAVVAVVADMGRGHDRPRAR